jgi:hypothetical protein
MVANFFGTDSQRIDYYAPLFGIPGMEHHNMVKFTGVPKKSTDTWQYNWQVEHAGYPATNDPRLDPTNTPVGINGDGIWEAWSANSGFACAAADAPAGSTVGDIWVFPFAQVHTKNSQEGTNGQFITVNDAAYGGGEFSEKGIAGGPQKPVVYNRKPYLFNASTIAMDASGGLFNYQYPNDNQGIKSSLYPANSPPISATSGLFYDYYDVGQWKYHEYVHWMFALMNMQACIFVPAIGVQTTIENRYHKIVGVVPDGDDSYYMEFYYHYKVQLYTFVKLINKNTTDCNIYVPPIGSLPYAFDIKSGLTFTTTMEPSTNVNLPDFRPLAPGPFDLTSSHHIVNGELWRKVADNDTEFVDNNVDAMVPMVGGNRYTTPDGHTASFIWQEIYTSYDEQSFQTPYMVGNEMLNMKWKWSAILQTNVDFNQGICVTVWKLAENTSNQWSWDVLAESMYLPKTLLGSFTWGGYTYNIYEHKYEFSLADLGETDPQTCIGNYRISYGVTDGTPRAPDFDGGYYLAWFTRYKASGTSGMNLGDAQQLEKPEHYFNPYPFTIKPLRLKTNHGVEVTTKYVKGKIRNRPMPEITWTGNITAEYKTVGNLWAFRLVSTRVPNSTREDWMQAVSDIYQDMHLRVKRKSDGNWILNPAPDTTTSKALIWWTRPHEITLNGITYTFGTGPLSHYYVTWESPWYCIDKTQKFNEDTKEMEYIQDDFEIEFGYGTTVMFSKTRLHYKINDKIYHFIKNI